MKKWKWIHKWLSLVLGMFFILWALSGFVLNHRNLVSSIEVNRKYLPEPYHLENWNHASVRSGLLWGNDSLLIYGNIGIWLTNLKFQTFVPFTSGLPSGIDNQRTSKLLKLPSGELYAGTQSGLYTWNKIHQAWQKIPLPMHDERITDLAVGNGLMVVQSRSEIFVRQLLNDDKSFTPIVLPPAANDDGKTSLFRTLWVIHSGEIFGFVGKLMVDFFAFTLIFLIITGYIYFFFPRWVKRRKQNQLKSPKLLSTIRFSVKWHNKIGIWIGGFLLLTTLTGMFLRPPLLISIASTRVTKIPGSILKTKNTWNDQLRSIIWNDDKNMWIVGTNVGLYEVNPELNSNPVPCNSQPPLSVMGINVMEKIDKGVFLVGSFNGLFIWKPSTEFVQDYITGELPSVRSSPGSPIGKYLIAGMIPLSNQRLIFEYNQGLISHNIEMPDEIKKIPMPLWNLALEVHTARIFQPFIGSFYILIIPLFGMSMLLILIAGIVLWFRKK